MSLIDSTQRLGTQSGLINDQLVRIFPVESFLPPGGPLASHLVSGRGAGPTTLPGFSSGGAAVGSPYMLEGMSSNNAEGQIGTPQSGASAHILGLPGPVFWVLVAIVVVFVGMKWAWD